MIKILETLTEEELKYFKKVLVKKDETLFYESEICKNVGFLEKGKLLIMSYLEDGKEVIYNIIKTGEVFGNNLIFSTEPFYRGDVHGEEESIVWLVDKGGLKKVLMENEKFLEAYLKVQSDFGKNLNLKIKLLTFNNAYDRFMYYLNINKGKIHYETISGLAKELNLTREVLSRLIHKLSKEGAIKIVGKTIENRN